MTAALRVVGGYHAGSGLSSDQEAAALKFRNWMRDGSPGQIFRLFGPAGCGKTWIAKTLANEVRGGPVFCAFTGKAALRMRQNGCTGASTIHGLIYKPVDDGGDEMAFVWQEESDAADAGIIVVDECSMVSEDLARDLMRYGKPMLVLGDPAQLPPVKGAGYLTNAEPDAMLTEVHRQALDNPILRLATQIREGGVLECCDMGALRIVKRGTLSVEEASQFDQVLCGTHRVRRSYTKQLRKHAGLVGYFPESGDRIMSTSNHRKSGLFNGQVFSVISSSITAQMVKMRMIDVDDDAAEVIEVMAFQDGFRDPSWKPTPQQYVMFPQFMFAQVMTVHKAQGSEWKDVLVYDDCWGSDEDRRRWRYTAITRAAERLTVVI